MWSLGAFSIETAELRKTPSMCSAFMHTAWHNFQPNS